MKKAKLNLANNKRKLRRQFLQVTGIALLTPSISGCAVAKRPNGNFPGEVLHSSAFPTLFDAVKRWQSYGGTLIIDRDYVVSKSILMTPRKGKSYRLTTDRLRKVSYVGPKGHFFFRIASRVSASFQFDGNLILDGNNRVSQIFWVGFDTVEGDRRRNCSVNGKLVAKNARQHRGFVEATGVKFSGGFANLNLSGIEVYNVGREAAITGGGSRGIAITGAIGTTISANSIVLTDFVVENVSTDDVPGSEFYTEADAVLIFQAAEKSGKSPVVRRGIIKNAMGRAIKIFAPGGGGLVQDLDITRNVEGAVLGSVDVNLQHGDGIVENVNITYGGKAHTTPTTPISFATSYARPQDFPFGDTIARNVRINDDTGMEKLQVIGLTYSRKHPGNRRIRIEGLYDSGISRVLFRPGAMGRYHDALIELDKIDVQLSVAVAETDDPLFYMHVVAKSLVNRGNVNVPVVKLYNGRERSVGWGKWQSDDRLSGVARINESTNLSKPKNGFAVENR